MPIPGIQQPDILTIDTTLRLKKVGNRFDFALPWYQDPETLMLVDGKTDPYDMPHLAEMYRYLEQHGELYWIELREGESWRPIGDVTFWQEDMPIVIGDPACRGKGVGKKVIGALISRGKSLGYPALWVDEIYRWNPASRRCFESLGFRPCAVTEKGERYCLDL